MSAPQGTRHGNEAVGAAWAGGAAVHRPPREVGATPGRAGVHTGPSGGRLAQVSAPQQAGRAASDPAWPCPAGSALQCFSCTAQVSNQDCQNVQNCTQAQTQCKTERIRECLGCSLPATSGVPTTSGPLSSAHLTTYPSSPPTVPPITPTHPPSHPALTRHSVSLVLSPRRRCPAHDKIRPLASCCWRPCDQLGVWLWCCR